MTTHAAPRPVGGRLFTLPVALLSLFVAIAFYYIGVRFYYGIGAVTNLNPGYPWGIWIVVDVIIGTAVGCGGFAMALLTYIFNRGQYHPLMRPALLGALFGYTLAGMAVMVDLVRYWQFYNLLLPWYGNPNSIMFEVALCVMAYTLVLWIEFSPAFLERFAHWRGMDAVRRVLDKAMFVIIALGVLLPTMHQSSLGSILLVTKAKLSPLWWTELLPLLFVLSAVAMGYAVVMFEATLVRRAFRTPSELPLLASISRVMMWLIAAFLLLRLLPVVLGGHSALAFTASRDSLMFWLETGAFGAAIALLSSDARRRSERTVFLAGCAALAGGSLYRLNSWLIAYQGTAGWSYFPSVPELMVTIGMVCLEILLYLVFVKSLPVLIQPVPRRNVNA